MDETTTVSAPSAPASTPSAPTSSPTSTPSSVQSTTDRPSFGEALDTFNKAAVQQGKKPRGIAPALAPPDGDSPSIQADGTTDPSQPPATPGPMPFAAHKTALDNARLKARAEVEQEFRTTYGDPQSIRQATQWFEHARRDRIGFVTNLVQEALADPELAPYITSLAGRTLGGNRPQPPAQASAQPPAPDFQDGQGNQFYSAKALQAREDWNKAQLTQEILSQIQPDLEQVRSERAQREQQAVETQLKQTMTGHLTDARQWPLFTEHEAAIKAALLQAPLTSGHPAEEALLLRRVYDRVVGPHLRSHSEASVVASLRERANASSLNPAATGAPSGIPNNARASKGGTMAEALRWAERQTSGQ